MRTIINYYYYSKAVSRAKLVGLKSFCLQLEKALSIRIFGCTLNSALCRAQSMRGTGTRPLLARTGLTDAQTTTPASLGPNPQFTLG